MTVSDFRKQALIAAAFGFAALACICITFSVRLRHDPSAVTVALIILDISLTAAFMAMIIRCMKVRSRVGKSEVSFISIKGGVPKKSPPVIGKRPPVG